MWRSRKLRTSHLKFNLRKSTAILASAAISGPSDQGLTLVPGKTAIPIPATPQQQLISLLQESLKFPLFPPKASCNDT